MLIYRLRVSYISKCSLEALKQIMCELLLKCSSYAVGFDIDADALEVFRENIENFGIEDIDLVQQDLLTLDPCETHLSDRFDCVVMNPPFGAQMAATPGYQTCMNALKAKHSFKHDCISIVRLLKKCTLCFIRC